MYSTFPRDSLLHRVYDCTRRQSLKWFVQTQQPQHPSRELADEV